MPFNSGFHSTLVDYEMKNDLVGLFVGVKKIPYLGKMGNLNQTPYFETKEKAKFIVPIAKSAFGDECTCILQTLSDTWKYSKPYYKWM